MGRIELVGGESNKIVLVDSLDDKVALEAIINSGNDTECSESLISRMNSVVAEKILALSIEEGFQLVFPISKLIERCLRNQEETTYLSPSTNLPQDTLAGQYANLEAGSDPAQKIHDGLKLGDTGLHYFAGMGGSRHFKALIGTEQYKDYNKKMAKIGYWTAVDSSKKLNNGDEGFLGITIVPIIERMNEVRAVLQKLMGIIDENEEFSKLVKKMSEEFNVN